MFSERICGTILGTGSNRLEYTRDPLPKQDFSLGSEVRLWNDFYRTWTAWRQIDYKDLLIVNKGKGKIHYKVKVYQDDRGTKGIKVKEYKGKISIVKREIFGAMETKSTATRVKYGIRDRGWSHQSYCRQNVRNCSWNETKRIVFVYIR